LRASVYDRIGFFIEEHKIAMDYDLLCRLTGESYAYINKTLVRFDDKGISSTGYLDSLKENIKVYESHFGFSVKCRLWQLRLKMLHYLLNTGVGKSLFAIKVKLGLGNA
jgi:hypothetical protein